MSQLSDLVGAGLSDVLPEYTLSPWSLCEYGDAEVEFTREHIRNAAIAGQGLPPEVAKMLIDAAMSDAVKSAFVWGRIEFDRRLLATSTLPFRLWLSLRQSHPKLTREQAAALLTRENAANVNRAILELLGFAYEGDKPKKTDGQPSKSNSTGRPSSEPSGESADSATAKSGG